MSSSTPTPPSGRRSSRALDASDDIILIVAPDFLALKNVTLGLSVVASLNYQPEQVTLVLNRSQSVSSIKLADVERGLQRKIDVEVPSDGEIVVSSINRGSPFVVTHASSAVAKAISQMPELADQGRSVRRTGARPARRGKGILKKVFSKKGARRPVRAVTLHMLLRGGVE